MFSISFFLLTGENYVNFSNYFREKEVGFEKEILEDSKKEAALLHLQPNQAATETNCSLMSSFDRLVSL